MGLLGVGFQVIEFFLFFLLLHANLDPNIIGHFLVPLHLLLAVRIILLNTLDKLFIRLFEVEGLHDCQIFQI